MRNLILALALALLAPLQAPAATIPATPDTLRTQAAAARPGDVVALSPGHYGATTLRGLKGITLDARAATVTRLTLSEPQAVRILGGTWDPGCAPGVRLGDCNGVALTVSAGREVSIEGAAFVASAAAPADGSGLMIRGGGGVSLADLQFKGLEKGVRFIETDGLAVARVDCATQRIDCITLAGARNGLIEDVTCRDTKVSAKEHPDCVQAWTNPGGPTVANITIRRLVVVGDTQGVGFFDGPFGVVIVEDSVIATTRPHGLSVYDAADLRLRNNDVRTLPGAKHRTKIVSLGSTVTESCGNREAAYAGKRATTEPACAK